MDDLGRAFGFPFRDPNWVGKFLLAMLFMLLALIGLGIPVLAGYFVQTTRRSMYNQEPLLPDWTDIGIMFITGFKFCVVYFLYLLPALLLVIPAVLVSLIAGIGDLPEGAAAITAIYVFGMLLIYVPYLLAFLALFPVITYRFAMNERISEALDIGAVLRDFRIVWPSATVTALLLVILKSLSWLGIFLFLVSGFRFLDFS